MVAFQKFNSFVERWAEGEIDLQGDTLKVLLTNVAPVAANSNRADLTEIANGNGYTTGGITIGEVSSSQAAGVYTYVVADITDAWVSSGAGMAEFQYAVLYDDTHASDALIGFWDFGSGITLPVGASFNLDMPAALITLS